MTSTDSWVIRRAAKYIVALDESLLEILDREEDHQLMTGALDALLWGEVSGHCRA